MIGDPERRPALGRAHVVGRQELGDVAGHAGDLGRPLGVAGLVLEHVAVVLHRGAAARRVDDHGVDRLALLHHARPGIDVALGHGDGGRLLAQMMHQRPAAAGVGGHLDVDAAAGEQADGGVVDLGAQHLLGAAREQDHALAPLGRGGGGAGTGVARAPQQAGRGEAQHRHHLLGREPGDEPGERARQPRGRQRQAEAVRIGQHRRQQAADRAVLEAALAGRLDVGARVVDEVHVVDAAGARGHAREAGEAAVDVLAHHRGRLAAALEHLLHQVDAPARAVALVAEQHVGGAGGRAEAAVHALSQDAIDLGDARVLELLRLEIGLHGCLVA